MTFRFTFGERPPLEKNEGSDPYSLLGVSRTAQLEDIRTAYRKLAKDLHPDVNPGDKKVEERFKSVTAAYNLLSDKTLKGQFDRGEIDANGNVRLRTPSYGDLKRREGAQTGSGTGLAEPITPLSGERSTPHFSVVDLVRDEPKK